jgi:hypothetical protein
VRLATSGVTSTAPAMRRAAARTSSIDTGREVKLPAVYTPPPPRCPRRRTPAAV